MIRLVRPNNYNSKKESKFFLSFICLSVRLSVRTSIFSTQGVHENVKFLKSFLIWRYANTERLRTPALKFSKLVWIISYETKILNLEVSTVEIDFYNQLRFFLTDETNFWKFLVEIFKIETFESRFVGVKIFLGIVKTNQDCQDLSRRIKICRDASRFVETHQDF